MKNRLLLLILFLSSGLQFAFAQWSGTDPAMQFTTETYTYSTSSNYAIWRFEATGGEVEWEQRISGGYQVGVTWTDPSAGSVSLWRESNGISIRVSIKPVSLTAYTPPTPTGVSMSQTQYCGYTTVTRSTSPQAGSFYSWYWQTSAGGTDTNLGNASSVNIYTGASLYLRARSEYAPYNWSSSSLSMGSASVLAVPTVAVSTSSQSVCSGVAMAAVTISNPNNVPGTTFSWTVASAPNISGASSGSGSSIAQTLSQTTNVNQTATYTATATANGCSSSTPTTVTVKPIPSVSVSPSSQSICSGATMASVTISNPNSVSGTSLSWTVSAPNISGASSGSASSISQTLSQTTNVNQTATYSAVASANGCSSSTPATVTVKPIPSVSVSPSTQSICSGATMATVSISNPNGVSGTSFSWTVSAPNISGASSGSGSSIAQTLSQTTNVNQAATYSAVASANGCSSSTPATVTVKPIPSVSVSPPSQSICSGATMATVTISNPNGVSGTSLSWTVSAPNISGASSGSGSSIAQTLSQTTNVAQAATYTASASANGCSSTTPSVVTVKPIPSVSASPSSQSICSGTAMTTVTISNPNSVSGTSFSWTVSAPNISGSSSGSGSSIAQTLSQTTNVNQTATYSAVASANGCSSSTPATVTVKPIPSVSVSPSSQSICSGVTMATVSISNPNSVLGTSFSWTVTAPNITGASSGTGSSISQTLTQITNVNQTATYTATANASGCSSSAPSVVSVKPIPTVSVSPSSQSICTGSAISVNIANPNSVSGTTFTWTVSASGITGASAGSGNVISQTLSQPTNSDQIATYIVTPAASGCSGQSANVVVTVVSKPLLPIGIAEVLFGSGQATITATPAAGADQVKWYTAPTGGTAIHTGTSYSPTLSATTYYYLASNKSAVSCEGERTPVSVTVASVVTPASVIVETIRNSGATTDLQVYTLNNTTQKTVQTTYFDGLMRPHQQVRAAASPAGKDIVAFSEYDANGMASTSYLPYIASTTNGSFHTSYKTEQATFYNTPNDKIADDSNALAQTLFEDSPLGRPLKQGSVGTDWQLNTMHVKSMTYTFNVSGDNVRRFNADGTSSSFYAANKLFKSVITNEQGNQVVTFTDDLGRTILQRTQLDETINGTMVNWLETYSVYDEFGRIKYTISPKGVADMQGNGWSFTQTIRDQYVYEFKYNTRGRVMEKKVPGSAWIYYIYDDANRLVLMQDGLLRNTNQWMFIKYDQLNRTVMQGLYTNTVNTTRASVQSVADFYNPQGETRGGTLEGYTNISFPITNQNGSALQVLSVSYYDNHDFDNSGTPDFSYVSQGLPGEVAPTAATAKAHGLATGSKRRVLETNTWLYTYVFYDNKGRAVQVRSDNHLSATKEDLATSVYDFEGKLLTRKIYHKAGAGKETTVYNEYVYDDKGRLVKVKQKHNSDPSYQTLAKYEYNELGQLVDKKLHDAGGESYLQSVDYRYTIRGQIETINNAALDVQSSNNDDTNDYFGLSLMYNTTETALGNTPYYDGNISAIRWKGPGISNGSAERQSYKFTYDKADRLKSSQSQMSDGTNWNQQVNALNEAITYDHNGNILSLARNQNEKGLTIVNSLPTVTHSTQQIDNLTYTYAAGNPVSKVEDATSHVRGFANGSTATTEYNYDTNGNLIEDKNKGITNIVYNFLGKPTQMTFSDGRVINYVYDAAGRKLSMSVTKSSVTTTTDYAGNFVYENGNLSFFGSPEGRVVKNGGNLEYQYYIADHQGNTRVVFTSATQTPDVHLATFEDPATDNQTFTGVPTTSPHWATFTAANNTPGGQKVVRLNQNLSIGPRKSIKVYPGDKIDMEVWTHYTNTSGFGTSSPTLTTLITNVATAFGGVSGGAGESGYIYNGVNSALGTYGTGGNQGDANPAAYLNYILFDNDYKVLDMGWEKVPASNADTKTKISIPTVDVKDAGRIFIYLSYEDESNNYVEFDDFKVTHTKTNILQYNEYYPFGLQTNNSWTRENSSNNFLYNAANELNQNSGWYETFFRGYDPAIGRFLQVDPLSFKEQATYQYAANNPVFYIDPHGASAYAAKDALKDLISSKYGGYWHSGMNSAHEFSSFEEGAAWALDYYFGGDGGGGGGGGGGGAGKRSRVNYSFIPGAKENLQAIIDGTYVYDPNDPKNQTFNVDKRLNAFLKRYFSEQMGLIKNNKLVIKADYDFKYTNPLTPGITVPLDAKEYIEGTVQIYINAHMLVIDDNAKLAYLTIGHELVHAFDQDNGTELELFVYDRESRMGIMEAHAYEWTVEAEKRLGVNYGAASQLEYYRSLIPADFDYDAWFKK